MNDEDLTEPQTEGEFIRLTYRMVKDMNTCMKDHEIRIRTLEGGFWKMTGMAAFVGFVTGWFGRVLGGGGS